MSVQEKLFPRERCNDRKLIFKVFFSELFAMIYAKNMKNYFKKS